MNIRDYQTKNSEQSVKEEFDRFKDMGEDELMSELVRRVNKSKENGTFDKQSLMQFVAIVSPRLTPEQTEKLERLISML